jgi:hypothetical protein
VSGLKTNLAKSELVPVGNVDNVTELAKILGCGVASLLLKYLGLPFGTSHKAKHIWDDVTEKIERRLASWKMLYLSKGGRLTLSNLPTYFMSLFPLLRVLQIVYRSFNAISYGVGLAKSSNIIW